MRKLYQLHDDFQFSAFFFLIIHVLLMISHHCVIKHYCMKCLVNTDVVFSFLIKFVSCILINRIGKGELIVL